jgi:predicted alpha/beta hydrolase family esterase
MTPYDIGLPAIIVPGLGGSEPEHWQSRFEASLPRAIRISGIDWDRPHLSVWTNSLLRAVEQQPNSVLIAHSLGCALIAQAAMRHPHLPVAGAMLVAPADIDASPAVPESLGSFAGVPQRALPFPSIVIASTNDPYMTPGRARIFASAWGAQLINIGACGHINVASGFGHWPEGQRILRVFTARLAAPVPRFSSRSPHHQRERT